MELYLAILAGALVAILLKLNKALSLGDFTWKTFLYQNGIPSLVNIILGAVAVYAKSELSNIYPITFVSCIVLGAAGNYVWKNLFDMVSPGTSTAIGINS